MDENNYGVVFALLYLFPQGVMADIIEPKPKNQVVLPPEQVKFNCASSLGSNEISWSFIAANSDQPVLISTGHSVHHHFSLHSEVHLEAIHDKKQMNLIINSTKLTIAGTYKCSDVGGDEVSAQLIALDGHATVESNVPFGTRLLKYDQIITLVCRVSYVANNNYVNVSMKWSAAETPVRSPRIRYLKQTNPGGKSTAESTIHLIPGYTSPFPVCECGVNFIIDARAREEAKNDPSYNHTSFARYHSDIRVQYMNPECGITVTGEESIEYVREGATLTCVASANPPVASDKFTWVDRDMGKETRNMRLTIYHSGEYMCTAKNLLGECTAVINVLTYRDEDLINKYLIIAVVVGTGCLFILLAIIIGFYSHSRRNVAAVPTRILTRSFDISSGKGRSKSRTLTRTMSVVDGKISTMGMLTLDDTPDKKDSRNLSRAKIGKLSEAGVGPLRRGKSRTLSDTVSGRVRRTKSGTMSDTVSGMMRRAKSGSLSNTGSTESIDSRVKASSEKQGKASSGTQGKASSGTQGKASSGTQGKASSGTSGKVSSGAQGTASSKAPSKVSSRIMSTAEIEKLRKAGGRTKNTTGRKIT